MTSSQRIRDSRHDIMTMGHHINIHGQHVVLNESNIKKGAQSIKINSIHMKKSSQYIMIKRHHIKK